jgi:ComEC/Rec2-related protein
MVQEHRLWLLKRTTLIGLFCACLLVGLALAARMSFMWSAAIICGVLVGFMRKRGILLALAVALFGINLGGLRGTVVHQQAQAYVVLQKVPVKIVGRAADDAVYGKQKQLTFDMQKSQLVSPEKLKLPGKIGVSGFGVNAIYRNDIVYATGKLALGQGGHQAWMSFATLSVTHTSPSLINRLRERFNAGLQSALPEPVASFGLGLLVGQRSTIPADVSSNLLKVGLVHVIAVSGYNLTILLQASRKLLGKRSKYQATMLSLALIGIFLLFTGNSPSIVRAAVVSVLSIGASYYGRSMKPAVLLLLAAAITGFANPLQVWGDVSWYLSFLAFTGVLLVGPLLHERFVPTRLQNSVIIAVMIESISAEMMTLPYVLSVFGQMSFVSLVANVLVVALVPLGMLLTLIAGLAGMLVPFVSGWFAWPANLLLTYMLDTSQILAHIPHIFVQNHFLLMWQMLACYGLVAYLVVMMSLKSRWKDQNRSKYSIITDRIGVHP